MRRIYLQSLKRGDSRGRGVGRHLFRTAQQPFQNQLDPGILQVLVSGTVAEEEVGVYE